MTDYSCWGESELIGRIMELERELDRIKDVTAEESMAMALCGACMDRYGEWPEGRELERLWMRITPMGSKGRLFEAVEGLERKGMAKVKNGRVTIINHD